MYNQEALYYFYSTIAQTLACGIGVSAAFVLYILQSLNKRIIKKGILFATLFKHDFERELIRCLDVGDQDGFFRMSDQFHETQFAYRTDLGKLETEQQILNLQSLYHLKQQKENIIRNLRISMPLTGGLIVFAIIMIPLLHFIKGHNFLLLITCLFSIAWLMTCLVYLMRIVREAIK